MELKQVSHFHYLGAIIGENRKQEREINNRIDKDIKFYYIMNNKFINKIKLHEAMYRSITTSVVNHD